MSGPARKLAYQRHEYSGAHKSSKRVKSAFRRIHGHDNRVRIWRSEEIKKKLMNDQIIRDNSIITSNTQPRTYARVKPKIHLEATYSISSTSTVTAEPAVEPVVDINWPQADPEIESFQLTVESVPNTCLSEISGYRIVELRHVIEWAFLMERHRNICESSQIEFVHERHDGFRSVLTFKCSMCEKVWEHCTESKDKINTAFVWATVTSGSYYTQAAHITSVMDIPTMSPNKFRRIEKKLGNVWLEHLTEEIKIAGEQEKSIAIKKGHVSSDGVPFVTVYVDGGWLKRSYGHNFDSSSGMACIIGKETKKCLFLGVRNKYCYTCQYYDRRNIDIKPHNCCKNFTGASTGMESDIIVEGFQKSEETHQLRYLNFIGDGDSSVFANLKEKVSYGNKIKKIECKNHVIKNYTSALYKVLANTKLPLRGRNILKPKVLKLTLVARKIIMYSSDNTVMAADLRNGPLHVFGVHGNCKDYYCNINGSEKKKENLVEDLKKNAPEVWALIYAANEKIALKAGRLSNETTNVAENFMSVINKFNCGKRISLGKAGSYQRRVHVAGLSLATGHQWHETAWKKQTTQSPGTHFKKYIKRKEQSRIRQQSSTRKRLFVPREKTKPDKNYGPEASDPIEIDEAQLRIWCEERLAEFQKSPEDIAFIEMSTVGQHENDLYTTHRRDRLTASQFGMVCKRRITTPCHNHVKDILYKKNICTTDMLYGQQNENVAKSMFMQQYNKTVRPSGLFIDEEFGCLAGSPDGVIENERALIEIKCFPSLARKNLSLEAAAVEKKNFALTLDNNALVMNKKHDYYYQV
ncbi:uncharacterized protein LOC118271403 isoform X2 [Spodoptera frugiperda]|nr:uncharacterized protein LOC118271403 isoform X2 [Spodoptera frugiperda]